MPQLPVTPADISLFSEGGDYVLRNRESFALYWYDRDVDGRSNCKESCATTWPPVVPPDGASELGDWTIIRRTDGRNQWAFRGKPLYTYSKDQPGGSDGNGIGGVWHLGRIGAFAPEGRQ